MIDDVSMVLFQFFLKNIKQLGRNGHHANGFTYTRKLSPTWNQPIWHNKAHYGCHGNIKGLKLICVDNNTGLINFLHLFESESGEGNEAVYCWLLTETRDLSDLTVTEWHPECTRMEGRRVMLHCNAQWPMTSCSASSSRDEPKILLH